MTDTTAIAALRNKFGNRLPTPEQAREKFTDLLNSQHSSSWFLAPHAIALLDQLEAATALAHSIEEARCNNFSKSGAQFWSDPRIITLATQLIECFELDLQDLMTSEEHPDDNESANAVHAAGFTTVKGE
ncbi:hypothetical protein ACQZ19_07235 [Rahnella variigena]|uniref:hypothetical protein n=1 Tax=Rahnella TaxID=34037 RepID=UPI00104DCB40|nr:hypothetical protein [Rahnella sp. JUb53]TCQ91630.1 hypothetical protein EC840_102188 [Rahnella sp. JUb53]